MLRRTSSTNPDGLLTINDLELQQAYDALNVDNQLAQTNAQYLSRISGHQFTILQGEIVKLKRTLTDMRARLLVIHLQNKKPTGKSQQNIYSKEYKQLDAHDKVFFISESVFNKMKMLKSTVETKIKEAELAIAKLAELSADLSDRLKTEAEVREQKARESESESKSRHKSKSRHHHSKRPHGAESETEEKLDRVETKKSESKPFEWLSDDLLAFAAGDYNARGFFSCGKSKRTCEAIETMLDDTKSTQKKYRYFKKFQSKSDANTKEQQLIQTLQMLVIHQNNVLENDDHWLSKDKIENIVTEYTNERGAFFSCLSKRQDNLVSFLKNPDALINSKWIAIDYFLDIKGTSKLKNIIQKIKNDDVLHDERVAVPKR